MEALTLAVGVSVLLETDNLEEFIENYSKHTSLVEQASKCVVDYLPAQGPGMSRIFRCSASDNTCLPLIGGLTEPDLHFLIGRLWYDKKTLFEFQSRMNTSGWPYVLLLLWHCACCIMCVETLVYVSFLTY